MLNLDDLTSSDSGPQTMMALNEGGFDMNQNQESSGGEKVPVIHVSVALSPVPTNLNCPHGTSDHESLSPKRIRIDEQSQASVERAMSYDQSEMKSQLQRPEPCELATFSETFPFLPSHSEGSASVMNYQQQSNSTFDDYNCVDIYENIPYNARNVQVISLPSNSYPLIVQTNNGTPSPPAGNQADCSLSMECAYQSAYYGYPSSNNSNNSSSNSPPSRGQMSFDKNSDNGSQYSSQLTNSSTQQNNNNSESNLSVAVRVDRRRRRYLKTVEFLKRSNLFEVTMKTADLIKRNLVLQKEMEKLKQEVSRFLSNFVEAKACM